MRFPLFTHQLPTQAFSWQLQIIATSILMASTGFADSGSIGDQKSAGRDSAGQTASPSHSSETIQSTPSGKGSEVKVPIATYSPEEVYQRTESILTSLGAKPGGVADSWTHTPNEHPSQSEMLKWLPTFDPSHQFFRFFDLNSARVTSFADRDAKEVSDFSEPFADPLPVATDVNLNLKPERPLSGLRVALDPGHMGTAFWDKITGKWVHDQTGKVISEGLLNLQVALLLKGEFETLGATVMLTRSSLAPVSQLDPKTLNVNSFAAQELRNKSLEPWFQNLIHSALKLPELVKAFQISQTVRSIFSDDRRFDYYAEREDLQARASKINRFRPDLTLMIHFDAADTPGKDPQLLDRMVGDRTRAYVPGAFAETEFATFESRALLVQHLMQPKQMAYSVELGRKIVDSISKELLVPVESDEGGESVPVAPGVFARNLELTRMVTSGAISYLECLEYGNTNEFTLLSQKDLSMQIDGQAYDYSKRLQALVIAIRDGVVLAVQDHGK